MCCVSEEDRGGFIVALISFEDIFFILTPRNISLFWRQVGIKADSDPRPLFSMTLHTLSHKLAHKMENVPNPVQSYDIWSVA